MLRFVLFELGGLFADDKDREISEDGTLWFLESLCQWNQLWLKKHPETPRLYDSKVVYKLPEQVSGDPNGFLSGEHFRDIPAVLENGGGDCDNVAAWRVAELRNHGYRGVKPYITSRPKEDGGRVYHALVWWPTPGPKGSTEDPSLILGMGGEERTAERAEEVRKNNERAQKHGSAILRGVRIGAINPAIAQAAMLRRMKGAA